MQEKRKILLTITMKRKANYMDQLAILSTDKMKSFIATNYNDTICSLQQKALKITKTKFVKDKKKESSPWLA